MKWLVIFVFTMASGCLLAAPVTGAESYLEGWADWVEAARVEWTMPGVAVAIVDGEEVVFAQGFGVLEQGKDDRVDADTLFAIASNTKMFTAAALGLLVEEGKLSWDDKVVQHLDGFLLWDSYRTGELTIRDALVHRAGYANIAGDLLWWESDLTREELVARLRYLEPARPMRARWGYSNFMYLVAGQVTEQVSGQGWDSFIAKGCWLLSVWTGRSPAFPTWSVPRTSPRPTRWSTASTCRFRIRTPRVSDRPPRCTRRSTTWRSGSWHGSTTVASAIRRS